MNAAQRAWRAVRDYFTASDPDLAIAMVPHCLLSMALFTRHPVRTNFIFDEQEALLANPYVRGDNLRWIDAFYRDFWGLPPERSIGSYRPVPDLVWRALWKLGVRDNPFLHHWVNVLAHGLNGALVTLLVLRLTKDRASAWLAGGAFTAAAVLTEAVSGVVGIADVLGGTGALMALHALRLRMPWMAFAAFGATLFGLYCKESALSCVPLVPLGGFLLADYLHADKPRRWARAAVALVATGGAFVLYVELRRRMFPARIAPELAVEWNEGRPWAHRTFAAMLRWYAQPMLPHDPLNNPLIGAPAPVRAAGALRVFLRGLEQVLVPLHLSGDYSAPQEPRPDRLVFPESVVGGLLMLAPFVAAPALAWRRRGLGPIVAFASLWVVISYFPVSNIPIALPTVRAERFWYFPAVGTSILVGLTMAAAGRALEARGRGLVTAIGISAFFLTQATFARLHANDYTTDLVFWDSTRKAVPRSAKAHLNYSIMVGARGDLEGRLASNATALALAPEWAMARVYYGDTLCRLKRAGDAWPHYVRGFGLGPNDANLIALGLQCLWEQKLLDDPAKREGLETLAKEHPGSWLDHLVRDVMDHGEEHDGVEPKYRPRGYNEGPKNE